MVFSGQMTPTFKIDVGKVNDELGWLGLGFGENEPMELDFSEVFQVNSDFYMVSNFRSSYLKICLITLIPCLIFFF